MRDVMTEVKAWLERGDPVAVATVISTWGSAPRPAGSRMAISQSGQIAGSVSGGCLEGEVFEQAQAILKGKPASLFHYGVSDDLAWTVGLSCGGEVDVLIEPLAQVHRDLMTALEAERPVVLKSDVGQTPGARELLTPDDPAITAALQGRPRYIGAIGSQKTHRERVARLTAAGVGEIERVHAPIGLDLGAQTAEETALAILSQMVAVRHRKLGGPMPGSA